MNENDMAPDRDDLPRRRRDESDDERPPAPPGNGMATAALVLGVLSLCGGIASIPGLICGIVGLGRANQRGGSGSGMAIAGMVLSGIGLFTAIPLLIALLLPAVEKVREAAARKSSANNLKQLSLGHRQYEGSHDGARAEPFHYRGLVGGEPSKPIDRLSWRVAMLPYLEQQNVYRLFHLDEPWNSPNNQPLSTYSIKPFIYPGDAPPEPTTRYRIFYGGGAGYDFQRRDSRQAIPDGASNTIAIVEGGERVTWSQFNEYPFSKDGPLPALGLPNTDVFQAAMFDGSVRTFRKSIDPNLLKSAIHAADGVGAPFGE